MAFRYVTHHFRCVTAFAMFVALFFAFAVYVGNRTAFPMDMVLRDCTQKTACSITAVIVIVRLRGKGAVQRIFIAPFSVHMIFRQLTFQRLSDCITGVGMCMSFVLLRFTDKLALLPGITLLRMHMQYRRLRLRKHIARIPMDMGTALRQRTHQLFVLPAAFVMGMRHIVRLAANDVCIRVIAGITVRMYLQKLLRADQLRLLYRLVAGFGMGMLFQPAKCGLFHGNCGKDQCVCGAEYNNTTEHLNTFPENPPVSVPIDVFSDFFKKYLLHLLPPFQNEETHSIKPN